MDTNIALGAQDAHWEKEGAFTGEVSCGMLVDAGCRYVIIGHSERRQYFHETNDTVNRKARAALDSGLIPIMCVGETLAERKAGKTFDVIRDHVENGLKGLGEEAVERMVNATRDQAQEAHLYVRALLAKLYTRELAEAVRIQYGGSVKPDNIKELMGEPDVDGALVGGASLKAESFIEIVKSSIKKE
jgi:triosephosphate isomerase